MESLIRCALSGSNIRSLSTTQEPVVNVTLRLRQESVSAEESGSDEETTVTTRVYRRRVILKVCDTWGLCCKAGDLRFNPALSVSQWWDIAMVTYPRPGYVGNISLEMVALL